MNDLSITGLYALKSATPYDFSGCIADTTHQQVRFCRYEDGKPVESWDGIVEDSQLFELLKGAGLLTREVWT